MKLITKGLALFFLLAISNYLLPVAFAATLSLSPTTGTFNKGCQFSVTVKLDTAGAQTDGTDAILTYESDKLTTDSSSITSGTLYPEYSGSSVREDLAKISISGLSSVTTPISGSGTLATIKFSVKSDAPEGSTPVKFVFDPNDKNNTTDSNVAERGNPADALSSVVNGNYTIGTGSCGITGSEVVGGIGGVGTPSGTVNQVGGGTKQALPSGGTEQLTYTMAIVGSVLTILGVLGLVLL